MSAIYLPTVLGKSLSWEASRENTGAKGHLLVKDTHVCTALSVQIVQLPNCARFHTKT